MILETLKLSFLPLSTLACPLSGIGFQPVDRLEAYLTFQIGHLLIERSFGQPDLRDPRPAGDSRTFLRNAEIPTICLQSAGGEVLFKGFSIKESPSRPLSS